MRRITTVLVLAILFTGCVDGKFHKKSITGGPCGTVTGYTYTGIVFGDSTMVVIPVSNIRANTEWRFYLLPTDWSGGATAYGNKTITIDGKVPPIGPLPPNHNDWIDVTATYDTATGSGRSRYIVQCVPGNVVLNQKFRYLVKVDTIGELDPRARVEK